MISKLMEFVTRNLAMLKPNSRNLYFTASLLIVISLFPAIGILLFHWKGWMVIVNYYTELWILGLTLIVRNIIVLKSVGDKKERRKLLNNFGGIMMAYIPFLLGIGFILTFVIPDELKGGTGNQGLMGNLLENYTRIPFSNFKSFITSPLMAVFAIAFHHVLSFRLNFYSNRKVISLKVHHKLSAIALARLFGMVMLILITSTIVTFVHSSAVDLDNKFLLNNEALLFPLTLILIKTFVDVRSHIKCNKLWVGDGFFGNDAVK